ncbi:HNH endonuclease [Ursidibacter arcticus]
MFEKLITTPDIKPEGLYPKEGGGLDKVDPFKIPDIRDLPKVDKDIFGGGGDFLPNPEDLPRVSDDILSKEKDTPPFSDTLPERLDNLYEDGDLLPKFPIVEVEKLEVLDREIPNISFNSEEFPQIHIQDLNDKEPILVNALSNCENRNENTNNGDQTESKVETTKITCRNESLAGQEHPVTGVKFEEKTVENDKGEKVTGVFPVFESTYDAQLPDDLLQASDSKQFAECNAQLKEQIKNDPELRAKFTEEQLEQIENGDTPDGYTWHHNEEKGKMQLVDTSVHNKTAHTGGKAIWGGGSENR